MLGHETSSRAYPEIGVSKGHHPVSHHGNSLEKLESLAKINLYLSILQKTGVNVESLGDSTGRVNQLSEV